MALYSINWKNSAKRELKKLDRAEISRVIEVVEELAKDPRPVRSRKLRGSINLYRVRVGDFRIVYEIADARLNIVVIRVGHRRNVYRDIR